MAASWDDPNLDWSINPFSFRELITSPSSRFGELNKNPEFNKVRQAARDYYWQFNDPVMRSNAIDESDRPTSWFKQKTNISQPAYQPAFGVGRNIGLLANKAAKGQLKGSEKAYWDWYSSPGVQEGFAIQKMKPLPQNITPGYVGEYLAQFTPSQRQNLASVDSTVTQYLKEHGTAEMKLPGWENWENQVWNQPVRKSNTLKEFGGVLLGMLGAVGMGPAGILKSAGMGAKTAAVLGGAAQSAITGGNPVIGALTSGIGAAKPFGTSVPGMMAQGAATSAIQGGNPFVGAALGGINRAQPFGASTRGQMLQSSLQAAILKQNPVIAALMGGMRATQPFGRNPFGQAVQGAVGGAMTGQNPMMSAIMGLMNARRQQPVRRQGVR